MKIGFTRRNASIRRRDKPSGSMLLCAITFTMFFPAVAADWNGVDESVIEKYAKEHGREARQPFINTDRGDLLLFAFLLAGAAGGFVAGYSWKKILDGKTPGKAASDVTTGATPLKGKR